MNDHLIERSICPACKTPGSGKLCSRCGENLHPKRITLAGLLKDVPDIFDLEFGLLYTVRTFFTRPGNEIKEYFAGDRQKHYKPLKFILFIGGLVTFLLVTFDISDGSEKTAIQEFETQWNSAILLLQFPVIALFTWLIYRKRGNSYGEHLVANAFLIGEVMMFYIIMFPILVLLNGTKWILAIQIAYYFWVLGYYTYAFYDWFYEKNTSEGFFKSMVVTIGIFIITMLVSIPLEILLFYLVSLMGF